MPHDEHDVDDGSERRKSPNRVSLMACRIELFLLTLTVVEKVSGLVNHWMSS